MIHFKRCERYDMADLREIMGHLRSPEGCPWDRAQDHHSIRANMLEEAYEAAEAIDEESPDHLKEELGDVLLQVVFHAAMSEEAGDFNLDDVINGVAQKLVFRHPHVFGDVKASDSGEALSAWDAQKQVEKGQKTATDTLNSVAKALPALVRAEKIQKKARKVGFDWDDVAPALDKVQEELGELREAIDENSNIQEELGDLLFAAVNVARFVDVEPEVALHGTCEKFIHRFAKVEELAGDTPLESMTLEEMDKLWEQAKLEKF